MWMPVVFFRQDRFQKWEDRLVREERFKMNLSSSFFFERIVHVRNDLAEEVIEADYRNMNYFHAVQFYDSMLWIKRKDSNWAVRWEQEGIELRRVYLGRQVSLLSPLETFWAYQWNVKKEEPDNQDDVPTLPYTTPIPRVLTYYRDWNIILLALLIFTRRVDFSFFIFAKKQRLSQALTNIKLATPQMMERDIGWNHPECYLNIWIQDVLQLVQCCRLTPSIRPIKLSRWEVSVSPFVSWLLILHDQHLLHYSQLLFLLKK